MSVTLYAQPYDLDISGFYFEDLSTYKAKAQLVKNSYGETVEEFEIQFIDGSHLYCAFADAYGINQANLAHFFQAVEDWSEDEKLRFIIVVGECGYSFNPSNVSPGDFEVDIYEVGNLQELAEQFIEDGLFGEIPEALQFYIDTDAIARDLAVDYTEMEIAGVRLIYRCG